MNKSKRLIRLEEVEEEMNQHLLLLTELNKKKNVEILKQEVQTEISNIQTGKELLISMTDDEYDALFNYSLS